MQWNQFYVLHTGNVYDEDLLPTGLEFKIDITGRDPSKWSVVGWFYGGQFWPTTKAFIAAATAPGFKNYGAPVDGSWGSTDPQGDVLPHDDLYPPASFQSQGTRYAVDIDEKYVEWSKYNKKGKTDKKY